MSNNSSSPTLLPSFVGKAIALGLEVREEAVREQTADLFDTIDHVHLSLSEARRLLAERAKFISVRDHYYFEIVLLNTEKALRAVQLLVEPIRIDDLIDQKLKLKTRARWIVLGKTRLEEKLNVLSVNYQSLMYAISTLQSVQTTVGFSNGGALAMAVDSGIAGASAFALRNTPLMNSPAHKGRYPPPINYPPSLLLSWKRKSRMLLTEMGRNPFSTTTITTLIESASSRAIELPTNLEDDTVREMVQKIPGLEYVSAGTKTPGQGLDPSLDVNSTAKRIKIWPNINEVPEVEVPDTKLGCGGSGSGFNQPIRMNRRAWLLQRVGRRT